MGLFDFVGDILGLSPPSTGEAMSKEDIAWLMEKGILGNQIDQQGLFTGFEYSGGGESGQPRTRTQTVNPALQPAIDRLLGGLSQGPQPYKNPYGDLLEAMLGERHQQYGLEAPAMPWNARFSTNQRAMPPQGPQQPQQPPAQPPAQPPYAGGGGYGNPGAPGYFWDIK